MSMRFVGVVAAVVLVGACGSDSGESGGADAEPSAEVDEQVEEPADDSTDSAVEATDGSSEDADADGEAAVATTDAPEESGDADGESPPTDEGDDSGDDAPMTGDGDSAWCVAARGVEDQLDVLDDPAFDFTDPAVLEETFGRLLDNLDEAVDTAPPEIADDVETTIEGFRAIDEAFADVDYDFLNADLSSIEENDARLTEASDRISAYNEDVCGIVDFSDDVASDLDDEADFDLGAGSVRDQTIAGLMAIGYTEEEASCVFDAVDFSDPSTFSEVEQYEAILEDCGISPDRILELLGAG